MEEDKLLYLFWINGVVDTRYEFSCFMVSVTALLPRGFSFIAVEIVEKIVMVFICMITNQ